MSVRKLAIVWVVTGAVMSMIGCSTGIGAEAETADSDEGQRGRRLSAAEGSSVEGGLDYIYSQSNYAAEVEIDGIGPLQYDTADGSWGEATLGPLPSRTITATLVGASKGGSGGADAALTVPWMAPQVDFDTGSDTVVYVGRDPFDNDVTIGATGMLFGRVLTSEMYESWVALGSFDSPRFWLERMFALQQQAAEDDIVMDVIMAVTWFEYDVQSGTAYSPVRDVTLPIEELRVRAGLQ